MKKRDSKEFSKDEFKILYQHFQCGTKDFENILKFESKDNLKNIIEQYTQRK